MKTKDYALAPSKLCFRTLKAMLWHPQSYAFAMIFLEKSFR